MPRMQVNFKDVKIPLETVRDIDKQLEKAKEDNEILKKKLELARLEKENKDMLTEIRILENDGQPLFM